MDVVKGQLPSPEQLPGQASGHAALDIVRKLDVNLGMQLRKFVAEVIVARRDNRFGAPA